MAAQVLDHPTDAAMPSSAQPNEPIRWKGTDARQDHAAEPVFTCSTWAEHGRLVPPENRRADGIENHAAFGEMLNDDGTDYFANLRSAKQLNEYTCRGETTVEPHFTYSIPVCPSDRADEGSRCRNIDGPVFHSAAPRPARFPVSSDLLNAIMHNIV
jgi:hypothetical protein